MSCVVLYEGAWRMLARPGRRRAGFLWRSGPGLQLSVVHRSERRVGATCGLVGLAATPAAAPWSAYPQPPWFGAFDQEEVR